MPRARLVRWFAPVAVLVAPVLAPVASAGPPPAAAPSPAKPRAGVEVEAKCVDESVIRVKLFDEKLEMTTKYGVIQVPVADVRRIEFGTRTPVDVTEKVLHALAKLNHSDYKVREAASDELKGYRERAYPLVLKALKSDDPEVSRRADEIAMHIRAKVPTAHLEIREFDVVHTDDSKITGRLTAEVLRVGTFQFGEQALKLADVRALRSLAAGAAPVEELAAVPQAPGNMSAFQQQFGKEMTYAVTGFTPTAGANPNLWGTDVYTLDSNLAAAVVHAGLAKPGETVVVKVRVVNPPQQFVSTFRNNVNSTAYGAYPAGAYEFVRR
jgi:hypothetical protein